MVYTAEQTEDIYRLLGDVILLQEYVHLNLKIGIVQFVTLHFFHLSSLHVEVDNIKVKK